MYNEIVSHPNIPGIPSLFVNKKSNGGGVNVPLLDIYPDALAAYSFRLLRTTYTGNVVRIRRDSDNQESDFSDTDFTDNTLLNWVGSNNAYIVTLYDQSVNGYDVVQIVAVNQPLLVDNGSFVTNSNNNISMYGNNNSSLYVDLSANVSQPFTVFSVFESNVTAANAAIYGTNPARLAYVNSSNNSFGLFSGNILLRSDIPFTDNITYLRTDLWNTSGSLIRINGVQNGTTGGVGSTHLTEIVLLDLIGAGAQPLDGEMSEIIYFDSNQLSNFSGIESNINNYYNIY